MLRADEFSFVRPGTWINSSGEIITMGHYVTDLITTNTLEFVIIYMYIILVHLLGDMLMYVDTIGITIFGSNPPWYARHLFPQ